MFKALIAGRSKDEIKKRLVTYVDDKIYSFDEDEMIFTTTEVLIENRDNEKSPFFDADLYIDDYGEFHKDIAYIFEDVAEHHDIVIALVPCESYERR